MSWEVVDYDVELYKDGCWHIQVYPEKSLSFEEAESRCRLTWRYLRWPCRVIQRRWLCGQLTETLRLYLCGLEPSARKVHWQKEGF